MGVTNNFCGSQNTNSYFPMYEFQKKKKEEGEFNFFELTFMEGNKAPMEPDKAAILQIQLDIPQILRENSLLKQENILLQQQLQNIHSTLTSTLITSSEEKKTFQTHIANVNKEILLLRAENDPVGSGK